MFNSSFVSGNSENVSMKKCKENYFLTLNGKVFYEYASIDTEKKLREYANQAINVVKKDKEIK